MPLLASNPYLVQSLFFNILVCKKRCLYVTAPENNILGLKIQSFIFPIQNTGREVVIKVMFILQLGTSIVKPSLTANSATNLKILHHLVFCMTILVWPHECSSQIMVSWYFDHNCKIISFCLHKTIYFAESSLMGSHWGLGTNSPNHRSWWMIVLGHITSKQFWFRLILTLHVFMEK